MKLKVYYDKDTDMLSLWNGRPATEADDVAENLVADFDNEGEVVGFTLEHASELLGTYLLSSVPRTEEVRRAFDDLLRCHDKIKEEFSQIDDSTLDEFLGKYNIPSLRQQVREYGDGHTLHSIPNSIDGFINADAVIVIAMNSPLLNENSNFNPFRPAHTVPYWRDGKGLKPYATVNERQYSLWFVVWEQQCSIHGTTTAKARKNLSFLQNRYPKIRAYMQEERQKSERFILLYKDWSVARNKRMMILTNSPKNSFKSPILPILETPQVKHIPTRLYGTNRRIMGRICQAIRES